MSIVRGAAVALSLALAAGSSAASGSELRAPARGAGEGSAAHDAPLPPPARNDVAGGLPSLDAGVGHLSVGAADGVEASAAAAIPAIADAASVGQAVLPLSGSSGRAAAEPFERARVAAESAALERAFAPRPAPEPMAGPAGGSNSGEFVPLLGPAPRQRTWMPRSFAASLAPRPGYDASRPAGSLKLGLRLGAWKLAMTVGTMSGAAALGYQTHGNYDSAALGSMTALGMVTSMALVAAIEELLFRGLLYALPRWLLSKLLGARAAVVLAGASSAALFVFAHETADPLLIGVRVAGTALLIYAYERGGLLASWTTHTVFNVFLLGAVAFGAAWGIGSGASVVALAAMLAAALWLAWRHDRWRSRT